MLSSKQSNSAGVVEQLRERIMRTYNYLRDFCPVRPIAFVVFIAAGILTADPNAVVDLIELFPGHTFTDHGLRP